MIKKITFLCASGLNHFIKMLSVQFQQYPDFEVLSVDEKDANKVISILDQSDIIWLEWGNEMAIQATCHADQLKLHGKQVVCRIHSYEALTDMIEKINWNVVTDVIFVAEHIKRICTQRITKVNPNIKLHVIPNGVDVDKYFIYKNKQYNNNVCFCGEIGYKKNPELMLQTFKQIYDINPKAKLHLAGRYTDLRYKYYLEHMIQCFDLIEHVRFHGFIEDMNQFFSSMDHIIISSPFESQHMACMEAMACGVHPIIHNFYGAQHIYPKKYQWNTMKDISNIYTKNVCHHEYRNFIKNNYSRAKEMQSLVDIL